MMRRRSRVALIVLALLMVIGSPMALAQTAIPENPSAPVGGVTVAAHEVEVLTPWLAIAALAVISLLAAWTLWRKRPAAE
jgi:uncharacterized membrane protein YozB (DUF420 family)